LFSASGRTGIFWGDAKKEKPRLLDYFFPNFFTTTIVFAELQLKRIII
jgi:hypothetical protein